MSTIAWEKIKILVVDDDELIRMTIRGAIKKLGCVVLEAQNGHEALAVYQKEKPALVITDMLMPDKEGLETILDIKALNPAVKIIAMSSGGSTQNMTFLQMAKKMGANHAMSKPIRPDELLNAIRSVMGA